jgi:Putative amidase domain
MQLIENRVSFYVGNCKETAIEIPDKDKLFIDRKNELYRKRKAEIVKCSAKGQIISVNKLEQRTSVEYVTHYQFLVKQKKRLYLEEQCELRKAVFESGDFHEEDIVFKEGQDNGYYELFDRQFEPESRVSFQYNRLEAVRYAERWWNSYNPKYKKFNVDCTNFISQCLHAGGAPMIGYPHRNKGWWMQNNSWSYSWTVANAFRWYLSGAKVGLRAREVHSPDQLLLGDVICYDFQGDGRFDHTTIVVGKDEAGMPLVNAHTTNSRMRYWSYEDSTAYTPKIKYKFFTIISDQ